LDSEIDPGRLTGRLEEFDLLVSGTTLLQLVLYSPPRPGMNELDEGLPEDLSGRLLGQLPTGWVDVEHLRGVEDEKGRRSAFDQRVEALVGWSLSLIHLASIIGSSNGWRYSLFHSRFRHFARLPGLAVTKDDAEGVDMPRWPAASDELAHLTRRQLEEESNVEKTLLISCLALTLGATVSPAQEINDEIAQAMLKEFISIRQAELDVTRKYLKRFQKILPAKKVARFIQLENKLDTVIDFELASEIPLVP